mmetsp:Transcript_46285/g.75780  ORF Transcript_46285/g.75780 Transcript_46285/m.75780 type:complete len:80 (+) Transcript_46285:104-343(+)
MFSLQQKQSLLLLQPIFPEVHHTSLRGSFLQHQQGLLLLRFLLPKEHAVATQMCNTVLQEYCLVVQAGLKGYMKRSCPV